MLLFITNNALYNTAEVSMIGEQKKKQS